MNLTVVIPVLNHFDKADLAVGQLLKTATAGPDIVVLDNDSDTPYCCYHPRVKVIRGPNLGLFGSLSTLHTLLQTDIVGLVHQDVLIWTTAWDDIILQAFEADNRLGIAGLAGGTGLDPRGLRIRTHTRLRGHIMGGDGTQEVWKKHGLWTPDEGLASAVLDGLAMFYRRETLPALLDMTYPCPHHFYDLETSLSWLAAGWHIRTLPIEADHEGTIAGTEPAYYAAVRRALGEADQPEVNWDLRGYQANQRKWLSKWARKLPVRVDADYSVHWEGGR